MSRATREHIRKLEAHIRDAASELDRVTAHEFVAERGHNNCQCGLCRAKRSLAACPFRDRGVRPMQPPMTAEERQASDESRVIAERLRLCERALRQALAALAVLRAYPEAPENWRDLAARVADLEDHIRLGIAEDRIDSSYGRDTEAVAVEAEIVARRGHDWGAVVTYPAPPLRPLGKETR